MEEGFRFLSFLGFSYTEDGHGHIAFRPGLLFARVAKYPLPVRVLALALIVLARTIFFPFLITLFVISFGRHTIERARISRLRGVPGGELRKWAEFFFSRNVYEKIFEPTLHDLFCEYCEALNLHRPWKARWVRIRGYWSFWSAVVAQTPISIVKRVYQIWKAIP